MDAKLKTGLMAVGVVATVVSAVVLAVMLAFTISDRLERDAARKKMDELPKWDWQKPNRR